MELTGICKEGFEKWYNFNNEFKFSSSHFGAFLGTCHNFHLLSESMQYGVYVDFFDSVGYYIYIKQLSGGKSRHFSVYIDDSEVPGSHILKEYIYRPTLELARKAAIEAANGIYNITTKDKIEWKE